MMQRCCSVLILVVDTAAAVVNEKINHGLLLSKHGCQMQRAVAVPVGAIHIQTLYNLR